MRSHLLPFTIPVRDGCPVTRVEERRQESASSATSEEKAESVRGGEGRFQNYGLSENPKKSILADKPEFRIEEYEEGSVSHLLQDRESETESSKNLTRRRSKRARRRFPLPQEKMGLKSEKLSEVKVGDLSEPVSSISEETSDEDVAFCLMLLSRDRWKYEAETVENRRDEKHYGDEDEEEDKNKKYDYYMCESEDGREVKSKTGKNVKRVWGKHRCDTCNKHFRSYQALGGHQASHKKARLGVQTIREDRESKHEEYDNLGRCNNKVHECPFCYRVFASGQALGGHKRSHAGNRNYFVATTTRTATMAQSCSVPERGMIDLNLPAMMDDEPSRVEFGDGVWEPSQGASRIVG